MVTKNFPLKKGQNLLFSIQVSGLYRYVGEIENGDGETGWLNCRIIRSPSKPLEYMIHMDSCGNVFNFMCHEDGRVTVETCPDSNGHVTIVEDATSSIDKSNLL